MGEAWAQHASPCQHGSMGLHGSERGLASQGVGPGLAADLLTDWVGPHLQLRYRPSYIRIRATLNSPTLPEH